MYWLKIPIMKRKKLGFEFHWLFFRVIKFSSSYDIKQLYPFECYNQIEVIRYFQNIFRSRIIYLNVANNNLRGL